MRVTKLFLLLSIGSRASYAFLPVARHSAKNHNENVLMSRPQQQDLTTSSALSAVVNIDESAQRDMGSFQEWAVACGVQQADGVQLAPASADG